ncbi:MAG: asparaginase [Chloroflexota bacterium]
MPRVVVVFTGGTISTAFDPVAGGNVPVLDGAALIARTPGLDGVADVVAVDLGRTPASHFTFPMLFEIAATIRAAADDPAVDGVVVVQGTDTIEETAFFWDVVCDGEKPIVVTGAMRASDAPGFDGPANLRDAVRVAADPRMRGAGVVVCLAGTIEPADDVLKMHTSSLTTFRSPNGGSLGLVDDAGLTVLRRRAARRSVAGASRAAERVHLITATVAMDGTLLDAAVSAGADGLVVAATGAGNTDPRLLAAAVRAMDAGIPVALASRCPSGAAGVAYAFPGGGATWVRAGALAVGHLCATKARVALAVGVGAGLDRDGLAALLADPADPADLVEV